MQDCTHQSKQQHPALPIHFSLFFSLLVFFSKALDFGIGVAEESKENEEGRKLVLMVLILLVMVMLAL